MAAGYAASRSVLRAATGSPVPVTSHSLTDCTPAPCPLRQPAITAGFYRSVMGGRWRGLAVRIGVRLGVGSGFGRSRLVGWRVWRAVPPRRRGEPTADWRRRVVISPSSRRRDTCAEAWLI